MGLFLNNKLVKDRILIISTHKYWPGISRLPAGLKRAGFKVFAYCPAGSFLSKTKYLDDGIFYKTISYSRTKLFYFFVLFAMYKFKPHKVIPGDEESILVLLKLKKITHYFFPKSRVAEILKISTGDISFNKLFLSKSEFVQNISDWGVSVPESHVVNSLEHAIEASDKMKYPVVLKIDSGYGGAGVYICKSKDELVKNFLIEKKITLPKKIKTYFKRLFFISIFDSRSLISIQKFLSIERGHCSFIANDGQLLAINPMLVLKSHPGKTGPSSVCENLDNLEIIDAVKLVVAKTNYSCFGSFDFMYDRKINKIYVIEFNCRPIPWAHYSDQIVTHDLCKALYCAMNNEPFTVNENKKFVIALFPNELKRDPKSEYLKTAYHDIPINDPDLKFALEK